MSKIDLYKYKIVRFFKTRVGILDLEQKIQELESSNRVLKFENEQLSKDITKEKLNDALGICFAQYELANEGMTISSVDVEETLNVTSIKDRMDEDYYMFHPLIK